MTYFKTSINSDPSNKNSPLSSVRRIVSVAGATVIAESCAFTLSMQSDIN